MEKIVILGAGPVGSMLASYLAKRDYQIEIYERRPDMRTTEIPAGRSINLALSDRGIRALEGLGLMGKVREMIIPMPGRMIHDLNGELTFQPYGKDGQAINSISRPGLNMLLIDHAEATGNVKTFFDHRCIETNAEVGSALIKDLQNDKDLTVDADIIFGADGAFSAVRDSNRFTDKFSYSQKYLAHGYKELVIPPAEDGGWIMEKNALHIWPRKSFMLIALPNLDGSYTVTLFLPFEGEESFNALDSDEKILAFFTKNFPDAVPLMPTLIEDYHENPSSSLCTVRCDPWVFNNKIALIGDAAHAVVPFYGQGMIAGFEDCRVLNDIIEEHNDNWDSILEAYQSSRKPNGDAIADLALKNFVEMRDKVADAEFIRRKKVEKKLMELYPDKFLSQYSMVTFSHIPYSEAWKKGNEQTSMVDEIMKIEDLDNNWDNPEIRVKIEGLLDKKNIKLASSQTN